MYLYVRIVVYFILGGFCIAKDNAVAESFFKTLKTEMVYHRTFQTKAEAKVAIFEYIEVWYNRKRRHSALQYLTPCQQEELLLETKMSA